MNDLNRALGEIQSIRRQMAVTTEFRGYGPATLAVTGLLAVVAAGLQSLWLVHPSRSPFGYLCLWFSTALLSAAVIVARMVTRAHRLHSGLADEMIRQAVEQFMPAAAAGLLLTVVIARACPAQLWMLPGLWQIIYSTGIFASCRFLPSPMRLAGGWYLITGLGCLMLAGERAHSPWAMAVPFAVGQTLIAVILWSSSREAKP